MLEELIGQWNTEKTPLTVTNLEEQSLLYLQNQELLKKAQELAKAVTALAYAQPSGSVIKYTREGDELVIPDKPTIFPFSRVISPDSVTSIYSERKPELGETTLRYVNTYDHVTTGVKQPNRFAFFSNRLTKRDGITTGTIFTASLLGQNAASTEISYLSFCLDVADAETFFMHLQTQPAFLILFLHNVAKQAKIPLATFQPIKTLYAATHPEKDKQEWVFPKKELVGGVFYSREMIENTFTPKFKQGRDLLLKRIFKFPISIFDLIDKVEEINKQYSLGMPVDYFMKLAKLTLYTDFEKKVFVRPENILRKFDLQLSNSEIKPVLVKQLPGFPLPVIEEPALTDKENEPFDDTMTDVMISSAGSYDPGKLLDASTENKHILDVWKKRVDELLEKLNKPNITEEEKEELLLAAERRQLLSDKMIAMFRGESEKKTHQGVGEDDKQAGILEPVPVPKESKEGSYSFNLPALYLGKFFDSRGAEASDFQIMAASSSLALDEYGHKVKEVISRGKFKEIHELAQKHLTFTYVIKDEKGASWIVDCRDVKQKVRVGNPPSLLFLPLTQEDVAAINGNIFLVKKKLDEKFPNGHPIFTINSSVSSWQPILNKDDADLNVQFDFTDEDKASSEELFLQKTKEIVSKIPKEIVRGLLEAHFLNKSVLVIPDFFQQPTVLTDILNVVQLITFLLPSNRRQLVSVRSFHPKYDEVKSDGSILISKADEVEMSVIRMMKNKLSEDEYQSLLDFNDQAFSDKSLWKERIEKIKTAYAKFPDLPVCFIYDSYTREPLVFGTLNIAGNEIKQVDDIMSRIQSLSQ